MVKPCQKKTQDGSKCKRDAKKGSKFCWQHQCVKQRGGQDPVDSNPPAVASCPTGCCPCQCVLQSQLPLAKLQAQMQPMPIPQQKVDLNIARASKAISVAEKGAEVLGKFAEIIGPVAKAAVKEMKGIKKP